MIKALIAFGANLGEPARAFQLAAERLAAAPGISNLQQSRLYRTEPVGGPDANLAYLNGAMTLETSLGPHKLLVELQKVQTLAGAKPRAPWQPREIDLDLVWMDQVIFEASDLLVPHPRMHHRWFVLRPAADLVPDAHHPLLGETMKELLGRAENSSLHLRVIGGQPRQFQALQSELLRRRPGATASHCPVPSSDITFHGIGSRIIGLSMHVDDLTPRAGTWAWILDGFRPTRRKCDRKCIPAVEGRAESMEKSQEQLGYFLDSLRPGTPI